MSVTLSPPMFLQFFNPNNSGSGAVGFKLFTYIAGTNTKQATWTDSTQIAQNANPLLLDGLGGGNIWGDPTLAYKFVWAPANDTDPPSSPIRSVDNLYFPLTLAALTQSVLGGILYPANAAEGAASVTPVNLIYPPGHVYRYGTNTTPGTTDMQTAITNAIAVGAQGVEVLIPPDVLAHSSTLVWGFAGLRVRCLGNATLKHTGTGVANSIDAGAVSGTLFNILIGQDGYLQELGNANTTKGWFLRGLGRCSINIRAKNAATSGGVGIEVDFAVLCDFTFGLTNNDGVTYTAQPQFGVILTQRGAGEAVAFCNFRTLFVENLSTAGNIGLTLSACLGCRFYGGAAEGCDTGVKINGSPNNINSFYDFDFESNLTADLVVTGGTNASFTNINSQSSGPTNNIQLSGGDSTKFYGGFLRKVLTTGSTNTLFSGIQYPDVGGLGIQGSGSYKAISIVPVDPATRLPTGTIFNDLVGETGTFTPTIQGGTTPGAQTFSKQTGTYTRVGKNVNFSINLVLTANSGGSGNATIGGLPFTSANVTQAFAIVDWTGVTLGTAGDSIAMRVATGLTTGVIVETGTTNALIAIGAISATATLTISGTYQIA